MSRLCEISLRLVAPRWHSIYTFPAGTELRKGRRGGHYWPLRKAARGVHSKHGCYSWSVGGKVHYVGSFSPYAKEEFHTGLEGRVHNYFQNHGSGERPNTNRWVFEKLGESMVSNDVILSHLQFEGADLGEERLSFEDVSLDKSLVLAIEALLIAQCKFRGECQWNRT